MNCEKCKNVRATMFYADEAGVRHALCASCGSALGRIGKIDFDDKNTNKQYFSEPFMITETERGLSSPLVQPSSNELACPRCSTTASELLTSGSTGCAFCYDTLTPHLALLSSNVCRGARMPRSYRLADEKKRAVAEYKRQIRAAVDGENYELAATLRDKIRALNDAK